MAAQVSSPGGDSSAKANPMLQFALTHARKRLKHDHETANLLQILVESALGTPRSDPNGDGGVGKPTATSQLMALLFAAGGSIQHADEAEASSDDDEMPKSAVRCNYSRTAS